MSNVGHIYVVLLEGGIVKTGKTKNPKSRISKSGFGNRDIVEFWVSREFVGYASAEAEMIKFLGCVGSVAFGREYFSGVDFSVAVERASKCVDSRSALCVKEQKIKDTQKSNENTGRVMNHFSGNGFVDSRWTNHVDEFRRCAEVVSRIILNRGVRGGSLLPIESLGGMSLFEFSLIICSYHCDDGAVEYFSSASSIVIGNLELCDDEFIGWFSSFELGLKEEIKYVTGMEI